KRIRQRAKVGFPTDGERERLQNDKGTRHHECRQSLASMVPQLGRELLSEKLAAGITCLQEGARHPFPKVASRPYIRLNRSLRVCRSGRVGPLDVEASVRGPCHPFNHDTISARFPELPESRGIFSSRTVMIQAFVYLSGRLHSVAQLDQIQ